VVVFNGHEHPWREIREGFPGDTGEGEAFLKPGSLWDGGLRRRTPHARAAAIRQPDEDEGSKLGDFVTVTRRAVLDGRLPGRIASIY
jgi:hypothetical protein